MDDIHQLQTDDSIASDKEQYLVNTIFNNKKIVKSFHLKQIVIMSLLFFIFSLPALDYFIETFSKLRNPYYKLAFKTFLFFVSYFLIINYLIKN